MDSIVSAHEEELRQLRIGSRRRTLRLALIVLGLFFIGGIGAAIWLTPMPVNDSLERAVRDYQAAGLDDYDGFATAVTSFDQWLLHHGIALEYDLFRNTATKLIRSSLNFVDQFGDPSQLGLMGRLYLALHAGFVRVTFMVLATWRLAVLGVVLALVFVLRRQRAYVGDDFLGQTGNSRIFFSGARVSYNEISKSGSPDQHVVGVACPESEPLALVRAHPLGVFLNEQGAATETNLHLAGIVLKAKELPAYAGFSEVVSGGAKPRVNVLLHEQSLALLQVAFQLWGFYRRCAQSSTDEAQILAALEQDPPAVTLAGSDGEGARYATLLFRALHRVNTPSGRYAVASVTAAELAAIVLSFEAGKVLAFDREGDRWVCRSRFPHLSARAVLHAQASFGREYDYTSRTLIRRALVYAARRSDFAPIRLPVDLAPESRAVRQWVELLSAQPHDLEAVADEIELLALVTEAHQHWLSAMAEASSGHGALDLRQVVATPHQIFFVPFGQLVAMLDSTVSPPVRSRIAALSAVVSDRQDRELQAERAKGDGAERSLLTSHERVLGPMSPALQKKIVEVHGVSKDQVQIWSTLRSVLASFAWLGRRVGDNPVSEMGIVFGVFEVPPGTNGANNLNLLGRNALVPLRGARLEEIWGLSWRDRLDQVISAKIGDSKAEFERLMAGIDRPSEPSEDREDGAGGPLDETAALPGERLS